MNSAAQVSAHVVIGADGRLAEVVNHDQQAWHDPSTNATHLGVELTQPRYGDPFSDGHINTLAWWLRQMSGRYGFALTPEALPFHSMTRSGNQNGKSDAFRADDPDGDVFMDRLMARLADRGWTV